MDRGTRIEEKRIDREIEKDRRIEKEKDLKIVIEKGQEIEGMVEKTEIGLVVDNAIGKKAEIVKDQNRGLDLLTEM